MSTEQLDRAIQLIKSGDRQAAIPILKEVIRADPRDENAWLWLYSCVEQAEQKKFCLQKALEINPANRHAQDALARLSVAPVPPVQPAPANAPSVSQPVPGAKPNPQKNAWGWLIAMGAGVLVLLCGATFVYFAQTGQAAAFAAALPLFPTDTWTPTTTPTFTPTVTRTPTATFSATATHRPRATFTPEPDTATPIPTIAPFTPGNPTATPLGSDIQDPNYRKGLAAYFAAYKSHADGARYQPVVDLMSAAIAANPQLAPPYQVRGSAYFHVGNCPAALADEEKAIQLDPEDALAWAYHGVIEVCLGNEARSYPDYQKALSIDPSIAFVHHNLGVNYYDQHNYGKALEEYSLAVAMDPTRSQSWSGMSEALDQLGRFDECISDATKALEAYSQEWLAYSDRASCELDQGKFSEAIKDYGVYVAHNRDDSIGSYDMGVAYGHRGDAYYAAGQYSLAIADYKKAVSLIRGDAHSYCNLAYSYFALKQYKNTIAAADASIAINPACGGQKLLEEAARSSYALHAYDQGIDYMNRAFAYGGSYPLGYYYRGILYQAAGRKQEAIQDLKQFLSSGPGGPEADDAKARLAELQP